jgi:hypothetical protein
MKQSELKVHEDKEPLSPFPDSPSLDEQDPSVFFNSEQPPSSNKSDTQVV